MKPTIGSLCTGYGGLDLAVSEFSVMALCQSKPILLSIYFGEFQ